MNFFVMENLESRKLLTTVITSIGPVQLIPVDPPMIDIGNVDTGSSGDGGSADGSGDMSGDPSTDPTGDISTDPGGGPTDSGATDGGMTDGGSTDPGFDPGPVMIDGVQPMSASTLAKHGSVKTRKLTTTNASKRTYHHASSKKVASHARAAKHVFHSQTRIAALTRNRLKP